MRREVIGCPDCGAPAHANVCEATRSRDALIKQLGAENERLRVALARVEALALRVEFLNPELYFDITAALAVTKDGSK
jgi:hypothetical protein